MTNQKKGKWCVVANAKDACLTTNDNLEGKHSTGHFKPTSKVYIFGLYAGINESVAIVGRHYDSNRYVTMILRARLLTNFRSKVVYSPEVIRQIESFSKPGCKTISNKDDAERLCKAMRKRQ